MDGLKTFPIDFLLQGELGNGKNLPPPPIEVLLPILPKSPFRAIH